MQTNFYKITLPDFANPLLSLRYKLVNTNENCNLECKFDRNSA